ncbi:STAS domain-containing protein [Myxococcota bacterium]|nr:STAS domain-containing protein [Myxococcota bacterium]
MTPRPPRPNRSGGTHRPRILCQKAGDTLIVSFEETHLRNVCTNSLRKRLNLPLSRARWAIFDFTRVDRIDSSIAGLLRRFRVGQQRRFGDLALVGISAQVQEVLDATDVTGRLLLFDDVRSAISAAPERSAR